MLKPCFSISDERTPRRSDVRKNDFCEKPIDSYFPLKKEIQISGDEFGADDTVSISHNLESSATLSCGDIAPSLEIRKCYSSEKSDEANRPLKEGDYEQKSELIASDFTVSSCNCDLCRNLSIKYISSSSNERKVGFCEEIDEKRLPLKKEAGKLKQISAFDFAITKYDSDLCADVSGKCISSSLDVQKDNFSEESEKPDFLLKEETGSNGSTLTASDFYSREISSRCISSNLGMQSNKSDESIQVNHRIEIANDLRENECSQERMSTSFKNSEEVSNYFDEKTDLVNAVCMQNRFLSSKKYSRYNNLFQEEKLPEIKDSKAQKDYSEDSGQTSMLVEVEKLLKCENTKTQNECLEESVQGTYPTEEIIYLKIREDSEIREELFQGLYVPEREIDFLKCEYSKVKMDYSPEKTRRHDALYDDCSLKILCSVLDVICKIDEDASSCTEKQNLISETLVESEDIHSEPYCVKSVQILLYFLDDVKRDLHSKKETASKLKLDSEAKVKELNSYDLENTKEGQELRETANNFVSRCGEVCAGIEKDRVECEFYSKNLKKMLNFFQEKCCFINNPAI
ncbi:hypothetical protein AVEN_102692-1 [Araneus ventricosus]|uniref:Uncharacterized protein n=1 Tax=Araneus ventricosus TaxID=182803 RepID=A0A4Y2SHA7_ARAVE|nr:hypothetical protein AVEN_102692-1 [Araneus ventricosus]